MTQSRSKEEPWSSIRAKRTLWIRLDAPKLPLALLVVSKVLAVDRVPLAEVVKKDKHFENERFLFNFCDSVL